MGLEDIHSLTDFQRRARDHIRRLKRSKRPLILTVTGKAELVVQDACSYQRLLERIERADALEGIRRGLESVKRGEGRPLVDALEDLRRKYEARETNGKGEDAVRGGHSTRRRSRA